MAKRILIFYIAGCVLLTITGCNDGAGLPTIVGTVPYLRPDVTAVVIPPRPKPLPLPRSQYGIPANWVPPSHLEKKGRWQGILIHHSASPYGSAAHEDIVHKANGWDGLGYQFVINNGVYKKGFGRPNGLVEVGYRWSWQKVGSHCRPNGNRDNYWNKHTIGICLIGNFEYDKPTSSQMNSLIKLTRFLMERYNIPKSKIKGHGDIKPTKCPGRNFPMKKFKQIL